MLIAQMVVVGVGTFITIVQAPGLLAVPAALVGAGLALFVLRVTIGRPVRILISGNGIDYAGASTQWSVAWPDIVEAGYVKMHIAEKTGPFNRRLIFQNGVSIVLADGSKRFVADCFDVDARTLLDAIDRQRRAFAAGALPA